MIKGLSLFSNVGIGELFLKNVGVDIVVSNELIDERAKFFKHIFPDCEVIVGDISKKYLEVLDKAIKNDCKFLIATPPCQGMSIAGKRNYLDKRNQLINYVFNMIEDLKPDYVLIENVPKILDLEIEYNDNRGKVIEIINKEFSKVYSISYGIINSKDYGIPQSRKRAFILFSKYGKWEFPLIEKEITVREVIGNLPSVEAMTEDENFKDNEIKILECKKIHKWHRPKSHLKRHIEIMKHTPTGKTAFDNEIYYPKKENGERIKGYKTTYKRMDWDKPAPTITMANGSISSQCNVHPGRLLENGQYSDARVLTVYEIMKLFTIPDDWNIPDWASENFIRAVIGEGIPPKLVEKIVKELNL